ncbi:MAG: transcriptional coactivator p15/PC4 family protein [Nitrospirota bacterium]
MDSTQEPPIARLRKSALEEIWVSLTEWSGSKRIDIRIYFRGENGPQPTQKGISLPLSSYEPLWESIVAVEEGIDEEEPFTPLRIPKNKTEEVRISLDEFKGHRFINMRVFYSDKEGEMHPTRKGITFPPSLLSEFKKALDAIRRLTG